MDAVAGRLSLGLLAGRAITDIRRSAASACASRFP